MSTRKELGLIITVKVISINLGHTIAYMQYTFIMQFQNYPITINCTLFFPTKKSPNISYMIYWDFFIFNDRSLALGHKGARGRNESG